DLLALGERLIEPREPSSPFAGVDQAADDPGGHQSRVDRVDRYPLGPQLVAERLDQPHQRGLSASVAGGEGGRAFVAGTDQDRDRGPAGFPQPRQGGADGMMGAADRDLDILPPVLRFADRYRPDAAELTGGADQRVETVERRGDPADGRLERGSIADV